MTISFAVSHVFCFKIYDPYSQQYADRSVPDFPDCQNGAYHAEEKSCQGKEEEDIKRKDQRTEKGESEAESEKNQIVEGQNSDKTEESAE